MPKHSSTAKNVTLTFPRIGNPWIDAGTVGLYRILLGQPGYMKDAPGWEGALPGSPDCSEVRATLKEDSLAVEGPAGQVQTCLEKAYDRLIACYYDISSKKQSEDIKGHNFYLDTKTETFRTFPKKKAAGVAMVLFPKAVRPAGGQVKWGTEPSTGEPVFGKLPDDYQHLQGDLDQLLESRGMKPGPQAGLLLDAGNEVRPKMKIKVNAKLGDSPCFLAGCPQPGPSEAKGTAFPLFGGSRSFMNNTNEKLRIGWQVDFVGKFVPAVAFFYQQGDDIHVFFPESNNLRRIDQTVTTLQNMVSLEPNLYRNFGLSLGGYFERASEVIFAFLHRVFETLSREETGSVEEGSESRDDSSAESLDDEGEYESEEPIDISSEAVYDALLRDGPVAFTVLSATKYGEVWMATEMWTFHDVVYLARLFERMQQREVLPDGRVRYKCSPRPLMTALIDFASKNDKTILRDRFCASVLRKQRVLPLIEKHAFHICSETDRPRNLSVLLRFAVLYEVERYEGIAMTKEDYKRMVEAARWLGNNIADGVIEAARQRDETPGRARGVFFRLRKTRTTKDFLDELARLQTRYPSIGLPKDSMDPELFNHETFEEFRGFCVVAALSRYQWKISTKTESSSDTTKQGGE